MATYFENSFLIPNAGSTFEVSEPTNLRGLSTHVLSLKQIQLALYVHRFPICEFNQSQLENT